MLILHITGEAAEAYAQTKNKPGWNRQLAPCSRLSSVIYFLDYIGGEHLLRKILSKDLRRNKVITTALFIFIMLSAMLVSSASDIITTLFSSVDNLFIEAKVPHFVQMHAGKLDQTAISAFAAQNDLVTAQQTVECPQAAG